MKTKIVSRMNPNPERVTELSQVVPPFLSCGTTLGTGPAVKFPLLLERVGRGGPSSFRLTP